MGYVTILRYHRFAGATPDRIHAAEFNLLRQSWLEWKQEMEERRAATAAAPVPTAT